ncbi:MAG: FIST C-terminal domain-containing protein [Planctomycetota bacterium]|jgi:hypothetical protein|nr:FIST C-terminal domain-containing protein [Planctomycetota bacterium]
MRQQDKNRFRTAHAVRQTGDAGTNATEAVRAIRDEIGDFAPTLVVFFASTAYDPGTLAREMRDAFPGAATMGCTTAGEQIDTRLLDGSVVAMAFSKDVFDYCENALVLGADEKRPADAGADVFATASEAMDSIGRGLNARWIDLDYREYVGFMLSNQISDFSEGVLDRVGEMTNVMFVGGFAGDDYKLDGSQRVMYDGNSYAHAAVLALWKPKRGFSLLKTQAATLTGKTLLVTRADEKNRIVWEFDGEDATAAYARAIGKTAGTMGDIDFAEYPIALDANGEPFLQAVIKQVDGKGLQVFARTREGTRRSIASVGDVVETTRSALAAKRAETGDAAAILHINCVGRHAVLKDRGGLDGFGALFAGVPTVAMSSYGEIWVGVVAQTSTMILFK